MKTRRLMNLDVHEISLIFKPDAPAVPGAKLLIVKADINAYLESAEGKELLGKLATEVAALKESTQERAREAELRTLEAQRAEAARARQRESWRLQNDENYWRDHQAAEYRRNDKREDARVYENQKDLNRPIPRPDPSVYRKIPSDFGK